MRWNIDEIDLTQFPADLFQPALDNWKQILKLPPYMKKSWIKSMQEEGLQHFRKGTFKIEKRGEGEEMIGVTEKFRAKQKQDENLEKCKSCWCLRGD